MNMNKVKIMLYIFVLASMKMQEWERCKSLDMEVRVMSKPRWSKAGSDLKMWSN
jgi:hypothetical protein